MNPPEDLTSLHVRGAIEGSHDDLAWVIQHFTPLLLAKSAECMGNQLSRFYDPADAVSHVWLVVLPKLSEITARDGRYTPPLIRFLSTVLVNHVNTLLRDELRRARGLEPASSADADPLDQLPSRTAGLVSTVVQQEKNGVVLTAIDSLRPEDRRIMLLRCVDRLGNKEAARLLGITPQAAATRLVRARERLLKQLQGSIFDELFDDG